MMQTNAAVLRQLIYALNNSVPLTSVDIDAAFPDTPTAPAVDMERVYMAAESKIRAKADGCVGIREGTDAAIAEYQRQMEGACGSGSQTPCSPSSSSSSSTSSTPEVGQSGVTVAASRMTDEELWEVYKNAVDSYMPGIVPGNAPTENHSMVLRAVADAAARAERVVVSVSDIRRSIIGECSVEVHVRSVANMLRSKGVKVAD